MFNVSGKGLNPLDDIIFLFVSYLCYSDVFLPIQRKSFCTQQFYDIVERKEILWIHILYGHCFYQNYDNNWSGSITCELLSYNPFLSDP